MMDEALLNYHPLRNDATTIPRRRSPGLHLLASCAAHCRGQ
jgi:hypothetical protein